MTTIRPMHPTEAGAVRDLWNEMCEVSESAAPAGWGALSAESLEQIRHNLERTPAHPDVLCLVAEDNREMFGFLTASVTRHAVMPGLGGEIEELYARAGADQSQVRALLAQKAIDWFHERGVGVIWSRVALDAPWTTSDIAFWTRLGFEHDQTLLSRYRPDTTQINLSAP